MEHLAHTDSLLAHKGKRVGWCTIVALRVATFGACSTHSKVNVVMAYHMEHWLPIIEGAICGSQVEGCLAPRGNLLGSKPTIVSYVPLC